MLGALNPRKNRTSSAEDSRSFTADLMRKVRRIEISTNRLVDQGVAGDYHSVFKGRGVEFSEVRPYQPGDDVRTIDWNVTARMGAPFVKTYVEERDLTVFLIVDDSGSLGFGSRAILKRELAAEIAALLSFAALRNSDRVGAALVSDGLDLFLHPRRTRRHALRLVREILARPSRGTTDLNRGVSAALRSLKQRSVVFLISDFIDTSVDKALKLGAANHDLVVIELVDPRDRNLPRVGAIPIRDAETGRLAIVSGSRAARQHSERREKQREELHGLIRKLGVDHLELRTDRPYMGSLLEFFERRKRRLRR